MILNNNNNKAREIENYSYHYDVNMVYDDKTWAYLSPIPNGLSLETHYTYNRIIDAVNNDYTQCQCHYHCRMCKTSRRPLTSIWTALVLDEGLDPEHLHI